MAERQIREIKVVIDTKGAPGLKEVADGFRKMNTSVKQTTSAVTSFRNAFLAIKGFTFAGIGFGELIDAADAIQKLTDRLTVSEGSVEAARTVLGKLGGVANDTKSSIEDIALVYNRLNLSLRETGISSDALLGVTQALQQSFRLSGSTAAEAAAATIQLSQGLASGQLRGQELRSVLEQNAIIGEILAKSLGKSRGELLKFAEKSGGIKAEVFLRALAENFQDINDRAEKLQPTVREGLAVALNDLKISLGDLNKEFGITKILVASIGILARNLPEIAIGVTTLGTAWFFYAKGAALAAAANTALMTFFGSAVVGWVVKFGIALAGAAVSVAGLAVGAIALTTAFVSALAISKDFRDSIGGLISDTAEWLKMSVMTDDYKKQYLERKKALQEVAVAQQVLVYETPDVIKGFQYTIKEMENGKKAVTGYGVALKKFADEYSAQQAGVFNYKASLKALNDEFLKDGNVAKYNKAVKEIQIKKLKQDFADGQITLEKYNKKLQEIQFGKPKKSLDEFRLDMGKLNSDFANGKLSISEYTQEIENAKLDKLTKDLKTGKTNVLDFNKAFVTHQIDDYNRKLAAGAISLNEYRSATQQLQLDQLEREFKSGKLTLVDYNAEVTALSDKFQPGSAFFTGTQNYIKQAGTLSTNVASAITNTFGNLETTFLDFMKTGKFQFTKFAESVIEDLNRIIVRSLIIRPLAQAILSIGPTAASSGPKVTGTDASTASRVAAKGAAFDGMRSNFFAEGGVIKGRTGFSYSGGRGIMGEAGPEAILPLSRGKDGSLGVSSNGGGNVVVNVINQGGDSEVQQQERTGPNGERILDIIIAKKIKETFASGAMDKQMATQFGLRRKGM
jgi:lambda family phage tail tape measure protein